LIRPGLERFATCSEGELDAVLFYAPDRASVDDMPARRAVFTFGNAHKIAKFLLDETGLSRKQLANRCGPFFALLLLIAIARPAVGRFRDRRSRPEAWELSSAYLACKSEAR